MSTPQRPERTRNRRRSAAALATVRLWGHDVGVVAEDPSTGTVIFEYTEDFRSTGLEISPRHLPLHRRGPLTFPELSRSDAFLGLPGVLADSLPDAYGNAVIKRYFEQRGRAQDAMSPVQRLLYIGQRAMGALEFTPPIDATQNDATREALEISTLVEQARRVIEGDTSIAIPEMMQVGATAGGARAKALILWRPDLGRVRSGFAPVSSGDEHWMIKFDGVAVGEGGHSVARDFRPQPYGRIEYAYAQMARRAGIDMSDTHLLHEREFAHFMTRRFDRVQRGVSLAAAAEQETSVAQWAASGPEPTARLHMHTLGGLEHADYNVRQLLSYEDWFRTIRTLQLGQQAVDQAYRRMVFNLMARNQDDHVKNIAFLMDERGHWSLAPAYDLTWAVGGAWTRTHQMTVRGKDDHFTRADLLAVGKTFDVPEAGARIIDDVEEGIAHWESAAQAVNLGRSDIDERARLFRHFAA